MQKFSSVIDSIIINLKWNVSNSTFIKLVRIICKLNYDLLSQFQKSRNSLSVSINLTKCSRKWFTESGVQLLVFLKPILERQGWWKGKLRYFGGWLPGLGEGGLRSKDQIRPWQTVGNRQRERATAPFQPLFWNWSCCGLISAILIVLSTGSL